MRTLGNIFQIVRRQSPLTLGREIAWRASRRWRKYNFLRLVAKTTTPVRIRMVPYYQPIPENVSDEQRKVILQLADGICQGKIPFLSYDTQDLGRAPLWNRDFIAGKEWPMEPSHLLPTVRFDGSDVKVPWELSRLQFLPILGKAYHLKREPVYRETARHYVEDWIRRNPICEGPNWMIAMEAALRALSMLFLSNLMSPLADDEKQWEEGLVRSLWLHLLFIEGHLEFSHIVRGNHYLSNILGLYALSVFLEGPGMPGRRRRYRTLLEREILLHVYEDGGNYEASSGYHVLVAQMFLTAYQLMRAEGVVPAQSFVDRLRKMFGWMEGLADSSGRLPHIGDCDDGRVDFVGDDLEQMANLPRSKRDSLRVSGLLGLGRALLGHGSSGSTLDCPWYALTPRAVSSEPEDLTQRSDVHQTVFPNSGIVVSRQGKNDLLFLAIPNGIGGKGTHTHNDKLSVLVRIDGKEVLCDAGTGCYTRDGEMRNRFRSTRAHNTVTVDGEEQNRIPDARMGFFSLGNQAHVSKIQTEYPSGTPGLQASHFGYADRKVVHTRLVRWTGVNTIEIEDQLTGQGQHRLDVHFQIGPGWKAASLLSQDGVVSCVLEGTQSINLVVKAQGSLTISEEPGAVSWVYGTCIPSSKIRVTITAKLPVSFLTSISWDEGT